jgi:hypothetical protein
MSNSRAHDIAQSAPCGSFGGDRRHFGGDVGQHHLTIGSDDLGRREPDTAGTAPEFEHMVAGPNIGGGQHGLTDNCAALVDEIGVLTPRRGRRGPHRVQRVGAHRCQAGVDTLLSVEAHEEALPGLRRPGRASGVWSG